MAFSFTRTIRFSDTDAAGVVYFANVLSICHEAYEDSLSSSGIEIKNFFTHSDAAYPIVHASVDFKRPMHCGDKVIVFLEPKVVDESTFEINYLIESATEKKVLANAVTRHVCINTVERKRQPFNQAIAQWLNYLSSTH